MILFQHQYTCTMQITDPEIQEIALRHGPQRFADAVSCELAPIVTGLPCYIVGPHKASWKLSLNVPDQASQPLECP